MERYNSVRRYKNLGVSVSVANVSLQLYLLYLIVPHSIGPVWQLLSLLAAYLVADFVNGLVHMFMDINDRYDSCAGPLIANFHLHHKIPQYKRNNLLVVYFIESGSKLWLAGYLLALLLLCRVPGVDPVVLHLLLYVGIFSSVAEVSHYLCHSSTSYVAGLLGNSCLLLSKRHHARHHLQDNCNYAFLNGASDPLLNLIASACCKGYKENTDLHYGNYIGPERDIR
jgi:sterol desaturase/sphingolipid hydroxylase (fatty acid hydroxylase superfamily)